MIKKCGNCKHWVILEHSLPDGTTYSYEDESMGNCTLSVPEWVKKSGDENNLCHTDSGMNCICYSENNEKFNSESGEKWLKKNHYDLVVPGHPSARIWCRPGWPNVTLIDKWWCVENDEHRAITEKSPKEALVNFTNRIYQITCEKIEEKSIEIKGLKEKLLITDGIMGELVKISVLDGIVEELKRTGDERGKG